MGISSNGLDIEEQKQTQEKLEAMVEQRTTRLQETVQDLEAFSYSIAHDMRAPLRSMNSYATILLQDQADKLDDEGVDFLRRIEASGRRLDRLITDILNYSTLVRGQLPIEAVDLEKLTMEVVESHPKLQEPEATVRIEGTLPIVRGNPAALTQVFSNLLMNAVKFVKPGMKPEVVLSGEKVGVDHVRIWFTDNGIGIPKEARAQIFQIFQRLHPEKDYEGTGIGLSIVRKAMERMGGKTGVESGIERGSRFWIELPAAGVSMGKMDIGEN